MYRAILSKNYAFFERALSSEEGLVSHRAVSINIMMDLRKCAIHPYLFAGVEPEPFEEGEHLVNTSGKFVLLDRILSLLRQHGHRPLIFSQFTRVLDIVQDYLTFRGYSYERLDGSIRSEERFASIRNFQQKNSEIFCFLLSSKSGGVGLNLMSADTVIFIDSDFNPQNDVQAAARCHRIGQSKPVRIIRLLARDTVDEIVYRYARRKLALTHRVMGTEDIPTITYSASELMQMIVTGLHKLFSPAKEESQDEFFTGADWKTNLERMIGPTDSKGNWINMDNENELNSKIDSCSHNTENQENVPEADESASSMYIFEGHDYKKDQQEMKKIIDEASEETNSFQAFKGLNLSEQNFSVLKRSRKRRALTEEEKEEMTRKRKDSMERTLRLEKERKEHKKEKAEDQHQQKWKRKGYDSILLPLPNSENIPPINNPGRNDDGCFGPHYVLGDVTQPKRLPNDNADQALILSCIDNGGHFGTGGVFNALRAKSQRIVDEYELCCGRNDDLHLGDAMLIKDICENHDVQTNGDELGDCDDADRSGRSAVSVRPRKESVVLMIVQSHKNRSGYYQSFFKVIIISVLRCLSLMSSKKSAESLPIFLSNSHNC
ncbi:hypothetical protein AB6A40_008159 [Gnathostoma spinigerum]|uniref:Helicase C-terminal domain-containing protein n=1 Tax=Gnathostoma spinigerum TaxID=75299 RepID=A0ABD6EYV5_9BILA